MKHVIFTRFLCYCHVNAGIGIELLFTECIESYKHGLHGLHLPIHTLYVTWLLTVCTWTQSHMFTRAHMHTHTDSLTHSLTIKPSQEQTHDVNYRPVFHCQHTKPYYSCAWHSGFDLVCSLVFRISFFYPSFFVHCLTFLFFWPNVCVLFWIFLPVVF